MEEGSQRHSLELQAQRRELLAKGNDDMAIQFKAWQERMQQEQAAMIAQAQAIVDRNSQLEAAVKTLQSQFEASQREQTAVASATALQTTAHRSESIAASMEVTEMKQCLLNSEVDPSKTVSAHRTFEAQANRVLQLTEESMEQRANQSLLEMRKACAEEISKRVADIQLEAAQSLAAAESRGFQRAEMNSMAAASGAGGGSPPNFQWTQATYAPPQPAALQINVQSSSGGGPSPYPAGSDPLFVYDPWGVYHRPPGGPGGNGPPGGPGGNGPPGGPGGWPQGPPQDPDPGRGPPYRGPPGPPPGASGGGDGGPPDVPSPVPTVPRPQEQKRKEADKIEIKPMPQVAGFRAWKLALGGEVAGASGDPQRGFAWIMEVEMAGVPLRSLENSGLFPTLDAKLAAALSKAIHGEFARRVNVMKEEHAKSRGLMLTGRQILFLLYHHYRTTEADGEMLDLQDLMAVRLANDDLRKFLNDWEMTLTGMKAAPDMKLCETLFIRELKKYSGFKAHMAHYDWLPLGHPEKTYDNMVSIVRRRLENKRRDQVREEHTRNICNPSYPASADVKREKGDCWSWTCYGKCTDGANCPFKHDSSRRGSPSSRRTKTRGGSRSSSPSSRGRRNSPTLSSSPSHRTKSPKGKDGRFKKKSRSPSPRSKAYPAGSPSSPKNPKGKGKGKTVCNQWLEKGSCSFGDRCKFEHTTKRASPALEVPAAEEEDLPEEKEPSEESNSHLGVYVAMSVTTEPRRKYEPSGRKSKKIVSSNKNAKITFGTTSISRFLCDTITERYDYHPQRKYPPRPFAPTTRYRMNCARDEEIALIIAKVLADQVARQNICAVVTDARWIVDSGGGLDLVSSKSLHKKDKLTKAAHPVTMSTANGMTTAEREWKGYIPILERNIDAIVPENSACNVLSLGKLCVEKVILSFGTTGRRPR